MTSAKDSDGQLMLSIIIPVFNAAPYLRESLDSIIQQNFSHAYEVILVDDCSTDGSVEICRQYSQGYPQSFLLIENNSNMGVCISRNLGLEQASGRYLMFVDADDILPPSAILSLFSAAEQNNADIVKGNLSLFDEIGESPAPDKVKRTTLVSGDNVLTTLYEHKSVRGHIGGKLFRRERLGQIRFPVRVRMAEDLLFFSELFSKAESLILLDKNVYRYRKHRAGSTGRKYEKGSYIDWLGAVENSGAFATSNKQKRAHKDLLVRTMAQIARECRKIPSASAKEVLDTIIQKCRHWDIRLFHLIFRDRLGLRGISRYIKLQLAIKQIRRNLSDS